jgi:Uma2 family endonuclease
MGPEAHRIPASYADFVGLLQQADYPLEYEQGEIIVMSIASDAHEQIVANLLGTLFLQLKGQKEFLRYGSNRHVYIGDLAKAYSPDASVVKGVPDIHEYAKGKTANTNPWLVAEVISPSSRNRDFGEKLQGYKALPSLSYILYVEQERPFVTLFERIAGTARWQSKDYDALSQELVFEPLTIKLQDLYDNLF